LKIARSKLESARRMRRNPTRCEDRIRGWLRDRHFDGLKWRRQYSIGGFILDFYCAELKLSIELDGSGHFNNADIAEYDGRRNAALERRGIETIRIRNETLIRDSVLVQQIIEWAIARRRKTR
jgi:very-short-patch-repair endonuclease